MGTDSLDINSLTGFSKYPVGRIGLDVTFAVSTRKKVAPSVSWLVLLEPDFELLNDGNGARSQLSLSTAFPDNQFGANSSFGIKDILDVEGDALVNATGGIETDSKESSVSNGVEGEAFVKE